MAKPIDHTAGTGFATAAGEGIKWGAIALLALPVAGAALGALVFGGSILAITAGLAAGLLGSFAMAPSLTIGGGLLGFMHGGNKVDAEKKAFNDRMRKGNETEQQKASRLHNDGEIAGVQQGYQMGVKDGFAQGQQAIIQQLQERMAQQQQMAMQQQMAAAAKPEAAAPNSEAAAPAPEAAGGFAAKMAPKTESKVDMIDQQRVAAAAATAQIG